MSQLNYLYHSVETENVKDTYTEYDTVDFNLDFHNRALVCGSVRLEGEIEILTSGPARLSGGERLSNDSSIGAHHYFSSCVTTIQQVGIIENATELPRYAKMETATSLIDNDMLQSKYVCELRSPAEEIQWTLMQPLCPTDLGGGATGTDINQHRGSGFCALAKYTGGNFNSTVFSDPDFSIKPYIALNKVVGGNNILNYTETGTVKLSFSLARNNEVLFGPDMDNHTYVLKNLRVCFVSVPPTPKPIPVNLRATLCLKSNVNSNLSNQSSRVPAICDSVALSFLDLTHEVSQRFNNLALERPPNLAKMRFMFNDSTSKYISYELKTQVEIVAEGLKALSEGSTSNNVRLDTLNANKGFVAGLKFGEQVPLQKQKFNVQIESGIKTARPFLMFAYFKSLLTV
tara:strand:- start:1211 stop:2416 length:1206 start_codon:yes stop_codon:yes gene_type:complete